MKDSKENFNEKKMQMLKMREEMLSSMGEKELRAFIKGYMIGQKMVFKQLSAMQECNCQDQGCGCGSNGGCNGCGKEGEGCNCEKS